MAEPSSKSPLTAVDVMTPSPRSCSRFSSVLEAVMIFRDADCGIVPIVEDGKPVGVLTDRDVALALADYPDLAKRTVEEIMTNNVVTVRTDAPLEAMRHEFGAELIRRLIVVDAGGDLVGVISWEDISPYFSDTDMGDMVSDVVEEP
ncbi:hypothetical protein BH23PLA1_BH23PLA1_12420 [soil metagenome]